MVVGLYTVISVMLYSLIVGYEIKSITNNWVI